MSADVSTCPGPDGEPIPLIHFENAMPDGHGMLAVSLTEDQAMFTTPGHPWDLGVLAIVLSAEDRQELGRRLLGLCLGSCDPSGGYYHPDCAEHKNN